MDDTLQRLKDRLSVLTEENKTLRGQVHSLEERLAGLEPEEILSQGRDFS